MEKNALSIKEFAEMYGIGISKASNLVHQQGFPAIRLGRRILILVDRLKEWMEHQPTVSEAG